MTESLGNSIFPRSAAYDLTWMIENQMGPNVLWLTESLTQVMDLEPGMRVLDMGCGRAVSSIFLAKEFGVQVWAADLWISASDNWRRVREAGLERQVFPIHAEAHALPFADEFFDAIVSMDAYHYFGTDDLYIGQHFARLVRHAGQIGIVVPGLVREFDDVPEHLRQYWHWDFASFHSPTWWRSHLEKAGKVTVELADSIPEGWKHWLEWQEICLERQGESHPYREEGLREAEMLRVDAGRNLGFTRMVARRTQDTA